MAKTMRYWLFKNEPGDFSIQDLKKMKKQTTHWDGVRNYQARNFLRDDVQWGDRVLFYHSNAKPSAIVGVARVVRDAYPDHTAQDPNDRHFDPKSSPDNPRWFMVDIQLEDIFPQPLALPDLRHVAALKKMELLRKGSRLSVQPVRKAEFMKILELAEE